MDLFWLLVGEVAVLIYQGLWILAVTLLDETFIFEWYMARFIVKNGRQKDTCYNEIGLCAQNIGTILYSQPPRLINVEE